jgi:5-methyltetrahydrofolate--homocysteine methyltransferase
MHSWINQGLPESIYFNRSGDFFCLTTKQILRTQPPLSAEKENHMELIGESMNIMNPTFLEALENKDSASLCAMARQQKDNGVTALDINLGQSKELTTLTPWVIKNIQGETSLPLFFSSHVLRQPEVLKGHQGTPVINAVTANTGELADAMRITKQAGAGLVVLLVSAKLTPCDVNGRLELASKVMDTAHEAGMPLSSLYLDPVISCRPDPASWNLGNCLPDMNVINESIHLLKEMSGVWKTVVALSNASAYLPAGKRSALHCHLLPLLAKAGLDAVIMNCLDSKLMEVAQTICAKLPDKIEKANIAKPPEQEHTV